jgi:hypothetical protein
MSQTNVTPISLDAITADPACVQNHSLLMCAALHSRALVALAAIGARMVALAVAQPPAVSATEDQLLDVGEAAQRLGVAVSALRSRKPPFAALRVNNGTRRLLFSARAIEQYLKSGSRPIRPPRRRRS